MSHYSVLNDSDGAITVALDCEGPTIVALDSGCLITVSLMILMEP